ncbi:hypothetical protein ACC685_38040, partial [Rhizobium ruizarguesonis]
NKILVAGVHAGATLAAAALGALGGQRHALDITEMRNRDEDFVSRLFVVNTHTPVLFFSSRGIVYKEKVWRLPIGTPTSRGKA